MPQKPEIAQIKGLAIWWVILIIVTVIVVGVVALSLIFPKEPKVTEPSERFVYDGSQIIECVGTIQQIQDNQITIKAEKERNPFAQDRVFTITVTEQTKLLGMDAEAFDVQVDERGRTLFIVKPDAPPTPEEQPTPSLEQMKTGDTLTAKAPEDITNQDAFEAQVLYYFASSQN